MQESDVQSIRSDIEGLAAFCDPEKPGHTRRSFTDADKAGRRWISEKMRQAGLSLRVDAMANIIGTLPGSEKGSAPIMIGSHCDTVMGGGRFDGIVGVLAGIKIAHRLNESGVRLKHPLEIVNFTSEEPSVFGLSTIGSRGMAGELDEKTFERTDMNGRTLSDAVCELGGNRDFRLAAREKGDIALYLELHIEQGPVLEKNARTLGVVTGIVGIHRCRVTVEGSQNHAGTTPMSLRRDALTGASELILKLEALCRERADVCVGTVGRLFVEPNAANAIPGRCTFEFEVRSLETAVMEEVCRDLQDAAETVGKARGLNIAFDMLSKSKPLNVDKKLQDVLCSVCGKIAPTMRLSSGAGHDANHIANIAPVAMIFVPSKGGKSHCPEEFTAYEDVTTGIDALQQALLSLDEKVK